MTEHTSFVSATDIEIKTLPHYTLEDKLRESIRRSNNINQSSVLQVKTFTFDGGQLGYVVHWKTT